MEYKGSRHSIFILLGCDWLFKNKKSCPVSAINLEKFLLNSEPCYNELFLVHDMDRNVLWIILYTCEKE